MVQLALIKPPGPAAARGECADCGLITWCLPAMLDTPEVRQLEHAMRHRRAIKRNGTLFHAGDALGSLYIVHSGSVKTSIVDDKGREQVTGFSLPGEIVGIEAIDGGKYPCNVSALEDSSFCGIQYADLNRLCHGFPLLQSHIHRVMSREITRDYGLIFMLGSMDAEERMATFLLNLLRRCSVLDVPATQLRLSMTRQDIASYLGLRVESISRILSRLGASGVIEVCGREIKVTNMQALTHIIGDRAERHAAPGKSAIDWTRPAGH
jgi:CRP/FNR family transcriptional regulator